MNRGVPPTAPNARTGELTPPGVTRNARANKSPETGLLTYPLSRARGPLRAPGRNPASGGSNQMFSQTDASMLLTVMTTPV